MTENIYATCVCINSKGVLLLGDSASGKSDMALRLINFHQAKLVADDRVDVCIRQKKLIASPPKILQGLLEVRNIGIIKLDFLPEVQIDLAVKLVSDHLERMPKPQFTTILGSQIPLIELNPFEISSTCKVLSALTLL